MERLLQCTDTADMLLYRMADSVIDRSGLRTMAQAARKKAKAQRIENLNELVTAARSFEMPEELEDMGELNAFVSCIRSWRRVKAGRPYRCRSS